MAKETLSNARNLAKSGNYKEAIKILRDMETGGDELPSALLLLLLCSYQVNTTEELLKKATVNLKGVELFARRPELNQLAAILQSKGNQFVANMMEYCYLAMILAGETDETIRGQAEKKAVPSNKRASAFSQMDKDAEIEVRVARMLEEKDFDPIEELDDIKFRFKRGLENPDVSVLSAGASLAMDLFTFNSRAYADHTGEGLYSYRKPDYESNTNEHKPLNPDSTGTRPDSAFDGASIRPPLTDEERTARIHELLLLINEEEKAFLP